MKEVVAEVKPTEEEASGRFGYIVARPGLNPKQLFDMLEAGVRAVILEGYHSGTLHACSEDHHPDCKDNLVPFLELARERQVPVFLTFGRFVGDLNNEAGYEPFDNGQPKYETSHNIVRAGIIPLRANWQQAEEVCQKMKEVLGHVNEYRHVNNYRAIIAGMYAAFPFKAPLESIQAAVSR